MSCEHFATSCGLRTHVAEITCRWSAVTAIPAACSSSVSKSSTEIDPGPSEDEELELEVEVSEDMVSEEKDESNELDDEDDFDVS